MIEAADGAFDPQTIYENAAPGVVTVTLGLRPERLDARASSAAAAAQGQGSGFVISERRRDRHQRPRGHRRRDHRRADRPAATRRARSTSQFADRNQVEAEIVGFDPFADVALLKVDPEGLDLHPLPLGSENDVGVGEAVAAIGSPFGQEQSLSVGVVSATDRSIESLTDFQIDGAIQTDASINPGNSGGPLLDADGEVVGINQQIQTSSGGNEGVGFAVPIDLAERSIEELRDDGEVAYAYAGVTTQPLYPQLAERLGLDADTGALVAEVVAGSPADEAGLAGRRRADPLPGPGVDAGGDVIVAVDGEPIDGQLDLPRMISLAEPGDEVTLEIIRDGEEQQIEVTLGERPSSSRRADERRPSRGSRASWRWRCASRSLPELGSHAGRAHAGAGARRRRHLRDRRAGGVVHGGVPRRARRPGSPSTRRTAAWSRPAGEARWVLVVDPIDGTRPAMAGFESACVSVALAPLERRADDGRRGRRLRSSRSSPARVFVAERGGGLDPAPGAVGESPISAACSGPTACAAGRCGRSPRCSPS